MAGIAVLVLVRAIKDSLDNSRDERHSEASDRVTELKDTLARSPHVIESHQMTAAFNKKVGVGAAPIARCVCGSERLECVVFDLVTSYFALPPLQRVGGRRLSDDFGGNDHRFDGRLYALGPPRAWSDRTLHERNI